MNHFTHDGRRCGCELEARKAREFSKEFKEILGERYVQLTKYIRAKEDIKVKHLDCGTTYGVTPSAIKNGARCMECYGNRRKTTEEFRKEVHEESMGEHKLLEGEVYKNNRTPLKVKHVDECGHVYKVAPKDFLNGNRCPLCKESKGERMVRKYLTKKGIEFEREKRFEDLRNNGSYMPYDFYIPEKNMLIEYDGEQHYNPTGYFGGEEKLKSQQKRDKRKNEYAKSKGIRLLRIPYYYSDTEAYKAIDNKL